MKGLAVLGNRRLNPQLWDMVCWDLSTTIYNMAIQSQDDPSVYSVSVELTNSIKPNKPVLYISCYQNEFLYFRTELKLRKKSSVYY